MSAMISGLNRPVTLKREVIDHFYGDELAMQEVSKIAPEGDDTLFAAQWRGAFDIEEPQIPEDHAILVWYLAGNGDVHGRHNRYGNADYAVRPGAISLHPADRPLYWRSEGVVDFMHFYLPKADLEAQLAAQGGNKSIIDDLDFQFSHDKALIHALKGLRQAAKTAPMNAMELVGWNHMIVGQVLRVFGNNGKPAKSLDARPMSDELLAKVRDLIEGRIDEKITLDEMAALTGWDVYRFSRSFRNTTGQPPHQYVLSRRIERARDMIANSAEPLAEIAFATGFSSQQHMTNLFSKHVGVSPAKYRREILS